MESGAVGYERWGYMACVRYNEKKRRYILSVYNNNSPHTSSYQYTQHVFDPQLNRIPMVYV